MGHFLPQQATATPHQFSPAYAHHHHHHTAPPPEKSSSPTHNDSWCLARQERAADARAQHEIMPHEDIVIVPPTYSTRTGFPPHNNHPIPDDAQPPTTEKPRSSRVN